MYFIYILSIFLFSMVISISVDILEKDKMYILLEEEIFLISLLENDITKELISVLPLKSKLIEENSQTIIIPLSIKFDTLVSLKQASFEVDRGDLFLFNGEKLVLYKEPTSLNNLNFEYIKIGYIKEIESLLKLFKKNKSVYLWNSLNYINQKEKVKPYAYYNSLMNYFTWKVFTFFCFLVL